MKYQLSITESNETWYILPSMGGHLISYYKLSKLLKDNCIGLTCKGIDRNEPYCKTLDEHTEYFLNLLDPHQESYNFIGYCMGGLFVVELDKYISINKSVIINLPYRATNLNYENINTYQRFNDVLYQNKIIWNDWFEKIYLKNPPQLKHTTCLIESYKDSNTKNIIAPNHYISIDVESHLNILNYPYVNKLSNYINTLTKSQPITVLERTNE